MQEEGSGEHGHGVGVVQEKRVRTHIPHIARKVQNNRNGAQGAKNPSDSKRVPDGLAQPVLPRDLEIDDGGRLISPHLHCVHDELRAGQGSAPVGVGDYPGAAIVDVAVDRFQHCRGVGQADLVNIEKRILESLKGRGEHAVPQDVPCENGAACPEEGYLIHDGYARPARCCFSAASSYG